MEVKRMKRITKWLTGMTALFIMAACYNAMAFPLQKYNFNIYDEKGEELTSGIIVQIYTVNTTTAPTIYSDVHGNSPTSATMTLSSAGGVSFYGDATTYDVVISDTPLTTSITIPDVTPVTHYLTFPKLQTYNRTLTIPWLHLGSLSTLTANDTQPIVIGSFYESSQTDTTATTINNFCSAANGSETNLRAGHLLVVKSNAAITFDVTSSGIVGGTTDIVTAAGDVTVFVYDGTSWYVVARMDLSDDLN
jgi:hypothetical protein